jgi:flagellar biosynthesis protein FlhA
MVMLLVIYAKSPLEFSSFPTLLLVITLYKLALNVASTRLILMHGAAFDGKIIKAFGEFVVGGNYVIGTVIFVILVIIQFSVITKGSGRIAEVAARFTLDAMPGKQMAIDADLNAGLIDESEARRRRELIRQEADFYGAMDGASKFVRGDTVAGIIITIINIVGGLLIGVLQQGMTAGDAARVFTLLTIGDGLVSQIPALLISTAAGMIVTRAGSTAKDGVGTELIGELLGQPKAILVTGGALIAFAFVPGLPKIPLFLLAGMVWMYAKNLEKMHAEETVREKKVAADEAVKKKKAPEPVEDLLQIDPMELELGYGLIAMVDEKRGGDLLNRVTMVRRECVAQLGIIIPPIRIRDNMNLDPNVYVVKLRGSEIARSTVVPDHYLAMNPESPDDLMPGVRTTEPAFGLPAVWISESQKPKAESAGFTVVNAVSVVSTHMMELIKSHAHELLGRQDVNNLLDNLKKTYKALVDEVVPGLLRVGDVQKVLQNLLREKVPVKDLVTILETLGDQAPRMKDADILTEYVRHALSRSITKMYQDDNGRVKVLSLDPAVEEKITQSLRKSGETSYVAMEPIALQMLIEATSRAVKDHSADGVQPVVLCSPQVRMYFRRITERALPRLAVLSYNEVDPNAQIESVGVVES